MDYFDLCTEFFI